MSDWSQFIPDIVSGAIVSIPVGVGVGIALWKWQKSGEDSRAENVANAEWRQARAVVAMHLTKPLDHRENGSNLPRFVAALDPLLETTTSLRVGEWAEAAPRNNELAAIAALHVDAWTLKRWAVALDEDMATALTSRKLVMEGHTARCVEWASAWILEISDPGAYVGDAQRVLQDTAMTMLEYPYIANEVAAFQKKPRVVAENHRFLRGSILNV